MFQKLKTKLDPMKSDAPYYLAAVATVAPVIAYVAVSVKTSSDKNDQSK